MTSGVKIWIQSWDERWFATSVESSFEPEDSACQTDYSELAKTLAAVIQDIGIPRGSLFLARAAIELGEDEQEFVSSFPGRPQQLLVDAQRNFIKSCAVLEETWKTWDASRPQPEPEHSSG